MNILLTGASGFVGRNIGAALGAAGHRISAISRRGGMDVGRMLTPEHWLPHLDGMDAVINCVGIIGEQGGQRFTPLHTTAPVALFRACVSRGIRRVVQISALGTDQAAFSAYHRSKLAADEVLRSLDLDWFVLRPSLIYGRGGGSATLLLRLARQPLIPLPGHGLQMLQPVHISDVVAAVLCSLVSTQPGQTVDVAGSQRFSLLQWLQLMRQAQGLGPARCLPVPVPLLLALAGVGRYLHPLLHPDNLRMLQAGYGADVQPLATLLGRMPQRVEARLFFSAAGLEGGLS